MAARPTPHAASEPRPRGAALRAGAIALVAAAVLVATLATPRIPQDPAYHLFADRRALLGVPNAANVLSNLAFLAAGLAGLRVLRRRRAELLDGRERAPWIVLFAGVVLVAGGSAAYHLWPTNGSLVIDRLPMSVGFMALLSAVLAERVDVRAGTRLLAPLVAAGAASVLWWHATELRGAGDLRAYYAVQACPLVSIPLLLALAPARYTGSGWLLGGLALYGVAKLAELRDAAIFAASGGAVSGHTLKHLLAAMGIGALVAMIARRKAVLPRPATART